MKTATLIKTAIGLQTSVEEPYMQVPGIYAGTRQKKM